MPVSDTIIPVSPHSVGHRPDLQPPDAQAADTVGEIPESWGIVLDADPPAPLPLEAHADGSATSWLIGLLVMLFVLIAVRLRKSPRFMSTLISDLTKTYERHSLFDNTVRESTLLGLLNLATIVSGGIIVASGVPLMHRFLTFAGMLQATGPFNGIFDGMAPEVRARVMGIGIMGIYWLFMWSGYRLTGYVFADSRETRLWIRGYLASMGVLCVIWLPAAMLCLGRPDWVGQLLTVALAGFVVAKMVFIWQGFRIFFTRFTSWVLFLYYLCSLEAVPVIIVCAAAYYLI